MAYDINAALERLENNLAEVESAKKQVEKTIATSESLQQIIGRYTNTLNAMGKDISSFIEEIRNFQDINTSELSSIVDAWRKRSIPTHSEWLYPLTFDAGNGLKEA